jgi:hypothetical protein
MQRLAENFSYKNKTDGWLTKLIQADACVIPDFIS